MADEEQDVAGQMGEAGDDVTPRPVPEEPQIVLPPWVPNLSFASSEELLDSLMEHLLAEATRARELRGPHRET